MGAVDAEGQAVRVARQGLAKPANGLLVQRSRAEIPPHGAGPHDAQRPRVLGQQRDRAIEQAATAGDAATLVRLLADDFVYTHSTGKEESRSEWIAGLLALFLTVLFVVKGTAMFPATAILAWAVLAYVAIDFGFWSRIFGAAPSVRPAWRAVTEVMLAAGLLVFLYTYLHLHRWHVRYSHVAMLWLLGLTVLLGVILVDPSVASGIARMSLGLTGLVGLFVIFYLALHSYDRAIMLIPTWLVLVFLLAAGWLIITGRLDNAVVQPAFAGGLVLIVMLIAFTVMQHAFAGGALAQGLISDAEQKALALVGAGHAVWDWDVGRDRISVGREVEQALGLERGALEGPARHWLSLIHPGDRDRYRAVLDTLVSQGRGRINQAFRLRGSDGQFLWFLLKARPIVGSNGEVMRCTGTMADVTDAKTAEERLLQDAVYDNLTGLPNRQLFVDRLETALVRRRHEKVAAPTVLLFDLDRFKEINDQFGHAVGDSVLLAAARRLPGGVAHVELPDVLRPGAELALGLDVHLPDAPELVEVVHERTAEERLQRLVHGGERDPLLEHLVAIDLGEVLRRARQERREQQRELGTLPGRGEELRRVLGEERGIATGAVFQHERDAGRRADARDGRGREREGLRLGHAGEPLVQPLDDHVGGEPMLVPRFPVLERDEVKPVVGRGDEAQQAEARDAGVVLDARRRLEDLVELVADGRRAVERGRQRELNVHVEVALVFVGDEATGQAALHEPGEHGDDDQQNHREGGLVDQVSAGAHVAVGGAAEPAVEAAEERAERPPHFRPRPQQQRGERRAQRERVECRDQHRDRDRDRELLVHPTGDPGDERGRDEHGGEDERDRHDRAGHLLHRLEGGVARRQPLLDVVLDRLDHHDGVVHHDADGQHEAEQGKIVD